MKKSVFEKEGLHLSIDARTIRAEAQHFLLTATEAERQALAADFELPALKALTVEINLFRDDLIHLEGVIKADMMRTCVVSNEVFSAPLNAPFTVLFSEETGTNGPTPVDFNPEDEVIEPLLNGKINLWEVIREQFGLALPLFPKKTDTPFEYRDPDDTDESATPKNNPFAALKHLLDL